MWVSCWRMKRCLAIGVTIEAMPSSERLFSLRSSFTRFVFCCKAFESTFALYLHKLFLWSTSFLSGLFFSMTSASFLASSNSRRLSERSTSTMSSRSMHFTAHRRNVGPLS